MSYFSNLFKTEFSKNVLTLMTGTTIAQAIPIAITPILTRLYTPDDFGVFALFLAITAIAGAVSNAQYEQAIVLPKKVEDSFNLVALGILIAILFSVLLLIVVFFFNNSIAVLLGNEQIASFLYLVPLSTLLVGIYNSLNFFNIRKKEFKNIANSQITRSGSLGISQILIGLIALGPIGLILGQIVSYFSGNTMLFKTLKNNYKQGYISKEKMKQQARVYKKFPLYSLPGILLNSINLNIVNFLISSFFSITTLGFYSLTQRIIGIPSRVIGSSIGQVYLQEASQSYLQKGNTQQIFIMTLKKLVILTLPIFLVLYFISEPAFAFVFGEEWQISGAYAKILIPLAAIGFINNPLTLTLIIHQKQQFLLIYNLYVLIVTLLIFIISSNYNMDFINILEILVFVISLSHSFLIYFNWRISKLSS